jgi:phage terminase large subunit-like protein
LNKIAAAQALAHLAPDFVASLSEAERLVLPYIYAAWLRPEQQIPRGPWSYFGFICGRGFGKSLAIACEVNRRVECGESRSVSLMAPTDDRVAEVQFKFLIDNAGPWFRPETFGEGLIWPNGVKAEAFTPEAPGRPRSGNYDLAWLCELVDWPASTRLEAFKNITTATRVGSNPQVLWDTTSKGQNDVVQHLKALNAHDPVKYPIQWGAMFDNPLLQRAYLETECRKYTGREYDEEVLGLSFDEAGGALWQQAWLNAHRVAAVPPLETRLVAIDPGGSARHDADETGIVTGGRDTRGHVYVDSDQSGRYKPEEWGDIAIRECADRAAAGVVLERNNFNDLAAAVLRARATNRGLTVHALGPDVTREPFPRHTPGRVYVREIHARTSKFSRGSAPAAETEAGRVHMVGVFPELERELTTYEQGMSRSPNRLDAFSYLVTELRELTRDAPAADPRGDIAAAVAASSTLNAELARRGRGRRVGL